jgi:hypothetical protein
MTNKLLEGWDWLATNTDAATNTFGGIWVPSSSTGVQIVSTNPRIVDGLTGRHLQIGTNREIDYALDGNYATMYAGFAMRLDTMASLRQVLVFMDNATFQMDFRLDATGHPHFTRNGTTIGSVSTTVQAANVWYYYEMKIVISNTVGSYELKINGVPDISASGLDTQTSANAFFNKIRFGGSTGNYFIDDIYLDDAAYAGMIRVPSLFPNGNGASSDLVGSDGNSTDNYLLNDDLIADGLVGIDTDYVESDVVGDHDTYAMTNLPTVPVSIYGAQAQIWARNDDAGARTVRIVTRSDGADYESASISPSSTYNNYREAFRAVDPDTSAAWTEAAVNAVEVGMKIQS